MRSRAASPLRSRETGRARDSSSRAPAASTGRSTPASSSTSPAIWAAARWPSARLSAAIRAAPGTSGPGLLPGTSSNCYGPLAPVATAATQRGDDNQGPLLGALRRLSRLQARPRDHPRRRVAAERAHRRRWRLLLRQLHRQERHVLLNSGPWEGPAPPAKSSRRRSRRALTRELGPWEGPHPAKSSRRRSRRALTRELRDPGRVPRPPRRASRRRSRRRSRGLGLHGVLAVEVLSGATRYLATYCAGRS